MRKKLLLAPLVAAALMVASSITAYVGIRRQQASLQSICQERIPGIKLAADTDRSAAAAQASIYKLLSMMEAGFPAEQREAVSTQLRSELETSAKRLKAAAGAAGVQPQEKASLEAAAKAVTDYQKVLGEVIELATVQVAMGTSYMSKAQAKYDDLAVALKTLRELEDQETAAANHAAEATVSRVVFSVLGALVISVVLSVVVALRVGSSVVRSVESIRQAAVELSQGDLRQRVAVEGSDEVAQTALKINGFIGSVHELVHSVNNGVHDMSAAAGHLSDASSSVAEASARQSDAASTVAAAVQQMTATASTIADNATHLQTTSKVSLENTEQGGQSVNKLGAAIEEVGSAFDTVNASVTQFVQSATSITAMTQQVKDLADQTNLLALNAAIEAARAGEQGRGFAVVADEVRKLAELSARAADDIEEATSTIGQQSAAVEASLRNGNASLFTCRQHATELDTILGRARQSVLDASTEVTDIANSVSEQSKGSAEVAQHVDAIAKMAQENSAVVERTLEAAKGLETLAQSLESAVAGFTT
jgi:methyl-accepting chemotaxis protein